MLQFASLSLSIHIYIYVYIYIHIYIIKSIDNVVYPCGFLKPMGTPKFFIVFSSVTFLWSKVDHVKPQILVYRKDRCAHFEVMSRFLFVCFPALFALMTPVTFMSHVCVYIYILIDIHHYTYAYIYNYIYTLFYLQIGIYSKCTFTSTYILQGRWNHQSNKPNVPRWAIPSTLSSRWS